MSSKTFIDAARSPTHRYKTRLGATHSHHHSASELSRTRGHQRRAHRTDRRLRHTGLRAEPDEPLRERARLPAVPPVARWQRERDPGTWEVHPLPVRGAPGPRPDSRLRLPPSDGERPVDECPPDRHAVRGGTGERHGLEPAELERDLRGEREWPPSSDRSKRTALAPMSPKLPPHRGIRIRSSRMRWMETSIPSTARGTAARTPSTSRTARSAGRS